MMKTIAAYALFTLCAFSAFAQGAGMKQYKSIDGKDWVCTTSAVSLVASEAALRLAGDLEGSNNVTALSGTVTALSGGVTASNILFNAWFAGLFGRTNYWEGALQPASTNGWEVGAHKAWLTNETDLAAMRAYHYGSSDIVESPAGWFVFNGSGTISGFNYETGRENVVIPWAIGGVPVTTIGEGAFAENGIVTVIAPQTVTMIVGTAFAGCSSLTSINLPQVTSIGYYAFADCLTLTAVHMGRNAPAEAAYVFKGITSPPNVYVTDPQATGWGAVWNGAPVVRPPLYADSVTVAGTSVVTRISNAVNTHVTGGAHTNVTLAGTVTIGGVARTDWPEATAGAITNGQGGMITMTNASGVAYTKFVGKGSTWGGPVELDGSLYISDWNGKLILADGSGLSQLYMYFATGVGGFAYWNGGAVTYAVRTDAGNVSIPNGTLSVTGTIGIGPTIGGVQAILFSNGTNLYFRNSNNVTNALTTN